MFVFLVEFRMVGVPINSDLSRRCGYVGCAVISDAKTATATTMPYGLCILCSLLFNPMLFVQRLDPSTTLATVDFRHSMPLVIPLGLPIDTSVLGVPFGIWPFELYQDSRQRVCILPFLSSIRKQARSMCLQRC